MGRCTCLDSGVLRQTLKSGFKILGHYEIARTKAESKRTLETTGIFQGMNFREFSSHGQESWDSPKLTG